MTSLILPHQNHLCQMKTVENLSWNLPCTKNSLGDSSSSLIHKRSALSTTSSVELSGISEPALLPVTVNICFQSTCQVTLITSWEECLIFLDISHIFYCCAPLATDITSTYRRFQELPGHIPTASDTELKDRTVPANQFSDQAKLEHYKYICLIYIY